jgi:hypothetical protein
MTYCSENHVLPARTTGLSDPIMGRPIGADPGQKQDPLKVTLALTLFAVLMPGLRPVSVKGIQAPLRRSEPPLTELAPLSPRGRGAGLPTPEEKMHPTFCGLR